MDKSALQKLKKEAKSEKPSTVGKPPKLDPTLLNIYTNGDGQLTDVSKIEVKKTNYLKIFLITSAMIAVFLAGISWLGFFLFSGKGKGDGKSLELKIETEKNIVSGQEITYFLEYANQEKVALKNVEISVLYPEGFIFISAEPAPGNQYNNLWQIGDLAKKQKGQIKIKGKIIGGVGTIVTLQATVSFQPTNFSSSFKESFSQSSQITSSILTIDLVGPETVLPEKKLNYAVTYKNTADQDLENVQVRMSYPEGFVFQKAEPKPNPKANNQSELEWRLEKLERQNEGKITVEGGFMADGKSEKEFKVQIGFLDEKNNFSVQQEKSVTTKIINQNLNLGLIINGASADLAVNFGETLNYSIVYKNLGQEILEDVVITAKIDSPVLDWTSLIDKNLGKVGLNEIVWTKDQVSNLTQLPPLAEGSLDFSIRLKNMSEIKSLETTNLTTKSQITAVIGKINELEAGTEVKSETITNSINTALELKVEGRYFDDDNIAVGAGPLPPVVGQKTVFRIFWRLANNLHEATEVKVQTKLPAGAVWEDKFLVSAGQLSYNGKDQTVIWTISKIPANKTFEDINVWFDIAVTPTKDQAGKLVLLTTETNLWATDTVTKASIVLLERSITSNLEDDPIGGGRGLVIDIE